MSRCHGFTKAGTNCRKITHHESGHCHLHQLDFESVTDSIVNAFLLLVKDQKRLDDAKETLKSQTAKLTDLAKQLHDIPGAMKALKQVIPQLEVVPDNILKLVVEKMISDNSKKTQDNIDLFFKELSGFSEDIKKKKLPEPGTKLSWGQKAKIVFKIGTAIGSIARKFKQ